MATSSFCGEDNLPLSHSESEWNPEQVASWLGRVQSEYEEEARLFESKQASLKAEISGNALAIVDRQCLKDIGIASIGKQLTILGCIKGLMSANTERESSQKPKSAQSPSKGMKAKITRKHKQEMTAEDKHLYHSKIKIIRKECSKRWPGNNKVYFRHNNNSLILSEMVSSLESLCTVKQIGFGQSAIRNHILQWVNEKNRKLSDGYDFEKSRTPAKRAISSGATDLSQSIDETDTEKPSPEDLGETCNVGVHDISLISDYSAQIICAVFFKVATFRNLSVKKHLTPAAKELHIKHRGNGKYEMANKIATELVKKKMVRVTDGASYKCLSRDEIVVEQELELQLAGLNN